MCKAKFHFYIFFFNLCIYPILLLLSCNVSLAPCYKILRKEDYHCRELAKKKKEAREEIEKLEKKSLYELIFY